MESIDAFIGRLPKVELHLHLVGSASVPTVLELRRRHPDGAGVPSSAADLAAFYEFRDFPHFSEVYGAVSSLVREPADVAELVLGAARDLAGQNVRYAELTVTPYTFTSAGMPAAGLTEALDVAARSARREHGVRMAYTFDIAGEFGGPAAYGTLEHALSCPPEALTGFGLAGIEQARPAFTGEFRSVFASAIAAGLHSVPHAGEMSGPAMIWEALDGLRAERIGHGISCLADPALVARLRESQIPLEVCPTSNLCTRQVGSLAGHPLPRMLADGLFVTLNSDDPPMFGTTLTQEYRQAASVLGLSRAQLADLAANGVRASFLEPGAKQALLAEIDAVAAGLVLPCVARRLPRAGGGDSVGIYKWWANTQVFPGAGRVTSRLAEGEDGALRGSTGGQDPMAEIVRAALIQQRWTGDKDSMIAAAVNHIQTAASAGAQVVCLQELFYGPYFCQVQDADYYSYTEAIPDGPTTELLQDVARQHGIVIVAPMYEEEHPGIYYNTAAVIDADGSYLGKYRKTHIPQVKGFWEKFYFRPGNMGYPVFDTAAGRIGVYICYDRHFPEGWRALGLAGARIVFNPSATSRGLSQYLWRLEQPAAAVANEYFVGAINRVGIEPLGDNDFYGQTYFADPRGQLAGDPACDDKDEVLVRDLDMAQLAEVRNLWQFYRDRRPDQYQSLVQP